MGGGEGEKEELCAGLSFEKTSLHTQSREEWCRSCQVTFIGCSFPHPTVRRNHCNWKKEKAGCLCVDPPADFSQGTCPCLKSDSTSRRHLRRRRTMVDAVTCCHLLFYLLFTLRGLQRHQGLQKGGQERENRNGKPSTSVVTLTHAVVRQCSSLVSKVHVKCVWCTLPVGSGSGTLGTLFAYRHLLQQAASPPPYPLLLCIGLVTTWNFETK